MRKLFVLFVILLFASFGIAAAQEGVDTTALAQYFPEDTLVYASLRTDDAYIDTLDGVLTQLAAALEGVLPLQGVSVRQSLDMVAMSVPGGADFETTFRPWLGDTIALGASSPAGIVPTAAGSSAQPETILAFEITDRAAAEAFLESTGLTTNAEESEVGDYAVYMQGSPEMGGIGIAISDEVVLVFGGVSADVLTAETSLADSEAFNAALNNLPEENYNILIYADTPTFFEVATLPTAPPEQQALIEQFTGLFGAQAVGFTILDGRTLTIDIAGAGGEMPLPVELQPTDASFADFVPADASLVIQTKDLSQLYNSIITLAEASATQSGTTQEEFNQQIEQLGAFVGMMTGLDFEEELLPALTGNYALFVSYAPGTAGEPSVISSTLFPDEEIDINIGAGLIIEAVDPEAAVTLADSLGQLLESQAADGMTVAVEEIGGVEVTVLSIETPENFSTPLDIILGTNEDVLIVATRPQAEAILNGEGGWSSTPGFAEAAAYAPASPTLVAYMDANGLTFLGDVLVGLFVSGPFIQNVFDNIVATLNDPAATPEPMDMEAIRQQQIAQLAFVEQVSRTVGSLISSSIISTSATEDGGYAVRLTLTLAE